MANKTDLNGNSENSVNSINMSLEEQAAHAIEVMDYVLSTNDIEGGVQMCEPNSKHSLYDSALKSLLLTVDAFLSFEKADIDRALKSAYQTSELCNSMRKNNNIFGNVAKMFKTPNYDKYSDTELHAELTHAKFLAVISSLSFIESPTFINLFKIALRMRSCHNSYKECMTIFKMKTEWQSETSRVNFEAGIRLANGVTNLLISHLPSRLLTLVNFLGVQGISDVAFKELDIAAFGLPESTVASTLAEFVFLSYYTYGQAHGGLGTNDTSVAEKILEDKLAKYPKSIPYKVYQAKLVEMSGDIDGAQKIYESILESRIEKTHKISHFELIGCHAIKCEWSQTIEHATKLNEDSKHSPAGTTYLEAVFKYTKAVEDQDDKLKQEASQLFKLVPTLRIRYVAKTVTPEKIAVENSLKYFTMGEFLMLPEMEILYHVNMFTLISKNQLLLQRWLSRVDKEVEYYKSDLDHCDYVDNFVAAIFYKGVIFKSMGKYNEALDCFSQVLNEEARIEREYQFPPQAAMEIGLTQLIMNQTDLAKEWFEKAKKDYSGYITENVVHVRILSALRSIGVPSDKDDSDAQQNGVEKSFNEVMALNYVPLTRKKSLRRMNSLLSRRGSSVRRNSLAESLNSLNCVRRESKINLG